MIVALSAAAAGKPYYFLSVFQYLHFLLAGLAISCNGAERHFYNHIIALPAAAQSTFAAVSIIRMNMFAVFQMEQRPQLFVAFQNNMTAASAIAAIRSTLRHILLSTEM